jgi:hypothetical protein
MADYCGEGSQVGNMLRDLMAALLAREAGLQSAENALQQCHVAFLNCIKSPSAHDRYAGIAERGLESIREARRNP